MTVLYQNNFDSLSDGTPSGWTASAGSGVTCYVASSAGNTAVSGTRVIGRNGSGDSANYTATGAITNQAMRSAQINVNTAHMHRCGADATTQGYVFVCEFDGTNMRVRIFDVNGFAELGNSGFVLPFTIGNTLHFETSAIGTTLSARIWKNAESRPSTATISVTNSAYSSGYVGVQNRSSSWGALDNVVITDGAGGEDYFYPSSTVTHATTGLLTAQSATLSGTSSRTGSSVTHAATATLTAGSSALSGTTSHASSGTFVSDIMINNTGTVQTSVPITWEWNKGVIGSTKTSTIYGTGTTSGTGTYTATGLPSGNGFLLATTADGSVYYQTGTVV